MSLEDNKNLVRRFYQEIDAGNLDALDELVAEDYLDHSPPPFPGLDRKLSDARDFERFTGSRLKLVTKQPVNNNRFFEGRLQQFDGRHLVLDVAPAKKKPPHAVQPVVIELANVERANLVPEI